MRYILTEILMVMFVVSPLMFGGVWIYNASAGAFSLQHAIRVAQNDRSNLIRIHPAKELDVLGFAATHDKNSALQYESDDRSLLGGSHLYVILA